MGMWAGRDFGWDGNVGGMGVFWVEKWARWEFGGMEMFGDGNRGEMGIWAGSERAV